MKAVKMILLAMVAMLAIACDPIKTVATVDVTVLDVNGKPAKHVLVARFNGTAVESAYVTNADEKHETNLSGVAHFKLKNLVDLGPAGFDEDGDYFTFRAFDKDNEPLCEPERVFVEVGEKKTLTLKLTR